MKVEELRNTTGLSKAAFAEKYNIPLHTLEHWESKTDMRHSYPFVLYLLERCVFDDEKMDPIENTMNIQEIRALTGLSKRAFADKYHMSKRALQEWEAGRRQCRDYVKDMLQRCVRYDERTRFYVHRTGFEIKSEQSHNILGVFDDYQEALNAISKLKQSIMAGDYDETWEIEPDNRKDACASLIIDILKAHELL